MENTEKVHQGQNIRRFREVLDMKQETLATELGGDWTQRKISLLEQKETVEPEILEQVAKILKVPVKAIERFTAQGAVTYFNSFSDHSIGAFQPYQCTFNPIDKIVELYEALVKSEKEKVELLQKIASK